MCQVQFYTCPTCEGAGKLLVRGMPCHQLGGVVRCPVCNNAGLVCVVDEFCMPMPGRPAMKYCFSTRGKERLS